MIHPQSLCNDCKKPSDGFFRCTKCRNRVNNARANAPKPLNFTANSIVIGSGHNAIHLTKGEFKMAVEEAVREWGIREVIQIARGNR